MTIQAEVLLDLTNSALREAIAAAGDNAYFLRKTTTLTTNAPPTVTTMPSDVKRLYRLEATFSPGFYIEWSLVRHDTSGNMVIVADSATEVIAHYRQGVTDLVNIMDTTPFPWEHEELITTMVQVRLAETHGPEQLLALLQERKARLMLAYQRDCERYERMRHEPMGTIYATRDEWATGLGGDDF